MPKLSYFEYAVVFHHKPEKDNAGNDITKDSEVLIPPTMILGVNAESVAKLAARKIPDDKEKELERCDVMVRPF